MNERVLMELVEHTRSRFYGKYRGTVTEIDTESDLGRIKAKVPAVLGAEQETGWCMPCVPYAGDKAGIAFLPEVGAGVWIEFEGGDVSYPIWVGCYWHKNELPSRVAPEVKVIRTTSGQEIVFDGKDHVITITDSSDNSVKLDRNGITILRDAKPKAGKLVVSAGKVSANDDAMEVT